MLGNTPKSVEKNTIFFRLILLTNMLPNKAEPITEKRKKRDPTLTQNSFLKKNEKISLKRV